MFPALLGRWEAFLVAKVFIAGFGEFDERRKGLLCVPEPHVDCKRCNRT